MYYNIYNVFIYFIIIVYYNKYIILYSLYVCCVSANPFFNTNKTILIWIWWKWYNRLILHRKLHPHKSRIDTIHKLYIAIKIRLILFCIFHKEQNLRINNLQNSCLKCFYLISIVINTYYMFKYYTLLIIIFKLHIIILK